MGPEEGPNVNRRTNQLVFSTLRATVGVTTFSRCRLVPDENRGTNQGVPNGSL